MLDSLGAVPDLIVGTSIGSIMGALYASGYTGAEIDSLAGVFSRAFFTPGEALPPRPWRPFTPLLVWEKGEQGLSLRSPAVVEGYANSLLSALLLRGNLLARGRFDSLPIPFRAVATDLATRDTVVLGQGDLALAVRASISVPLVFAPVALDSLLLVDGGMSANVPIGVARALGATRVIVSDVSAPLRPLRVLASPIEVANQLAGFLFQQPPDSLGPDDLYIRVDMTGVTDLGLSPQSVDTIMARGRRAVLAAIPGAACLPRGRRRAVREASRIGLVEVEGGIPGDARVLGRVLGLTPGASLDEAALRAQVIQFGGYDTYHAAWLGPHGSGDTVSFQVGLRRASPRIAGVTVAYDNDLGGRLGLMYLDRHFFGTALEGSGTLGLSRLKTDLTLGVRRYFGVGRARLAPAITGRFADQKIVLYNEGGQESGRPNTEEAVLFAGLERELGTNWVLSFGFDGRVWRDADTTLEHSSGENGSSGGVIFRAGRHPGTSGLLLEGIWSGTFRRLQWVANTTVGKGRVEVTPQFRFGWGEFLPLQQQFPLGGSGGFPGLPIEGLRGDREVYGAVQTAIALRPPFSLRLLIAAGRSANGGDLFASDGWLGGARAGLGLDTPIGPVQFEYGLASEGRDQLFVRIGRWF